jgi:hypothetical protein
VFLSTEDRLSETNAALGALRPKDDPLFSILIVDSIDYLEKLGGA